MSLYHRALFPCLLVVLSCLAPFLHGENGSNEKGDPALAAESQAWGEKETRLAGIYLGALQAEPVYGHMLDQLWRLYQKHGATADLLESMQAQAAEGAPVARLIHGHLLRKSGDLPGAIAIYDELLNTPADPQENPLVPLVQRARAEVAVETGDEKKAVSLYESLLQSIADEDPEKIGLLVELGNRHTAMQNAPAAGEAWHRALQLARYEPALTQNIAQRLLAAGRTAECLALYERLAADPLPERRFAALEEIARLYELQEDFAKADGALTQAQAMTHFRDARYVELLRRRVRLHEHFDKLPEMETRLVTAARAVPADERAMLDAARFFEWTVRADQRLAWLRQLAALAPSNPDYRGDLIDTLLQLDGEAEAATLLDALLAQPGNDTFAWVQKRAELEARKGQLPAVEARLRRWLAARPNDSAATNSTLNYARLRRLDSLAEEILRRNVASKPEEIPPVLELAGFLLERNRHDEAAGELKRWVAAAPDLKSGRERNQRAAQFLAGRDRRDMAEPFARAALLIHGAGTGESLLLAEVLFRENRLPEAVSACEQAWELARDDVQRREANEKLLAILSGNQPPPPPAAPPAVTAPLGGFGQGPPSAPPALQIPAPARDYAQQLIEKVNADSTANLHRLFRAAWWAARARLDDDAFRCLDRLRRLAAEAQAPLSAPAEKLLLELAEATQKQELVQRQIAILLTLEPANRDEYLRRLAASYISGGERERGEKVLRDIHQRQPGMTGIAEALIRSYRESGRFNEAITLWEDMLRNATPAAARQLLRPYAQALTEAGRKPEAFAAYLRIIPQEKDPRSRLELLEEQLRFLPPPPGAVLDPIPADQRSQALESALKNYAALASAHPFDPFYHEALARIHEIKGDAVAAFAELKRGYYLSRSPAQNLPRLRAAAVKAEDQEAAVYFQKQILAQNTAQHTESEWRTLVELLENNFRTDEADDTRRRMERQFSQDADILERIARHYEETQQFTDAIRLRKALANLRKGDLTSLWAYVRLEINEGDPALAEPLLDEILLLTKNAAEPHRADDDRMPFPPLLLGFEDHSQSRDDWRNWAESVTQMTSQEEKIRVGALTAWLNLPHAYLQEDALEGYAIRLNALKAKAVILAARGGPELASWVARWREEEPAATVSMRMWALGYAGAIREMLDVLAAHTKGHEDERTRFLTSLLALANGEGARALGPGDNASGRADFTAFRQAFGALSNSNFTFPAETIAAVYGDPRISQDYAPDINLGREGNGFPQSKTALQAWLKRSPFPHPVLLADMSRIARSQGDWAEEEHLLGQCLDRLLVPGSPAGTLPNAYSGDAIYPWFYAIGRYGQLIPPDARPAFWQRAEAWALSLPSSPGHDTLLANLAAEQGRRAQAEHYAWRAASRLPYEPGVADPLGKKVSGIVIPTPDSTSDLSDFHHQEFWRVAHRSLSYLPPSLALVTGRRLMDELGPLYRGNEECAEFSQFSVAQLQRELLAAPPVERQPLTREALARTPTAEAALMLAMFLEKNHHRQEAAIVLESLTHRASSNSQYAEKLLQMCRESGDTIIGQRYLDRLFSGEIPQPPPGLSDAEMYQAHAVFLRLTDPERLSVLANLRPMPSPGDEPLPRPPADIHYLRELLALHLAEKKEGLAEQALARLSSFLPNQGALYAQHGQLLEKLGRKKEAAQLLAEKLSGNALPEQEQAGLRADLLRLFLGSGEKKQALALLSGIMRQAKAAPPIIEAANTLTGHGYPSEARSFLSAARRQARDKPVQSLVAQRLLQSEIEMSGGELTASLPTLRFLLTLPADIQAGECKGTITALDAIPLNQRGAWAAWFLRQTRRPARAPLAALGFILLTDHSEEIPGIVLPLLTENLSQETGAMLEHALNHLMDTGRWQAADALLAILLPHRRDPLAYIIPCLRQAAYRQNPVLRQEALRTIELGGGRLKLLNLLIEGPEKLADPSLFAQVARQLISQMDGINENPMETELCLEALLRVGDTSSARRLLQAQITSLSPGSAVKALLSLAEASGRLDTFEQDLASYQPTSGIRSSALRAWKLRVKKTGARESATVATPRLKLIH